MLTALIAAALALQTAPPPPQAADEGSSTVVAELEVVARPPGPAIWRVHKGESDVFILGALSPLPHSLAWDDHRVRRAIDGARVVLTPPEAQAGVFDLPGLAIKMLRLRSRTPLERQVPAATYARVLAAAKTAHLDPGKLQPWRPAPGGLLLLAAFQKAAGLSLAKPGSTVERLAKAAHVKTRPLARLKATPLVDALVKLDDARQLACLEAAAAEVQWEATHAVPAAQAWSQGRLADARAQTSGAAWERCVLDVPTARALVDRGVADGVAAVEAELARPGKAVAVVDLRYLTAANGLLDQLRARGAEITVPALN